MDIGDMQRRHTDDNPGSVTVKRLHIKTPVVDIENRTVQGLCSAETIDLDGDVVQLSGIDTTYFLGADDESGVRTVYLDHDYARPIGTCRKLKMTSDGLYAQTYITRLPIGDEVMTLVQEGIIRGMSIGFRSMEASDPTIDEMVKYGRECSRVIRKSLLLEYSLTPMPANPDAMMQLQSLVAKSRIRQKTADLIKPQIIVPQPQTLVTSGRVFTIN